MVWCERCWVECLDLLDADMDDVLYGWRRKIWEKEQTRNRARAINLPSVIRHSLAFWDCNIEGAWSAFL